VKIELSFNYTVDLADCKLDSLTSAFKAMILGHGSVFCSVSMKRHDLRVIPPQAKARG